MPQSTIFAQSLPPCPIDAVLPEVCRVLALGSNLVLSAPPGAGKSSRVPLCLLHEPWLNGRNILLLEPRRVAARALARYTARLLGETPGQTVGLRMRGETVISPRTRIEVVTEGVLLRMLQEDPELSRIACVIFDEFHERSLDTDTGLALCLESRAALRPDLRLLAMSATLDAEAAARLMGDCPTVHCEGRAYPVTLRYLPLPPEQRLSGPGHDALLRHAADVILHLLRNEEGSLLVFLPGAGEIRRLGTLLEGRLPPNALFCPLYGRLSARAQDAAVDPAPHGLRKITAATAIAETSLTIEGVRMVVDTGLARSARFDPATGLSRLITERVSLAGAAQRAGRAGRTEPGICCRLWAVEEEHGMRRQIRPEILDADLSGLALHLAAWGVSDPAQQAWLDPPPAAHLAAARQSLRDLELLDAHNRPTALGKRAVALPLAPRTARMLLWGKEHDCGARACCLAALMEESDALLRGAFSGHEAGSKNPVGCDINLHFERLCRTDDAAGPLAGVRRQARRLARLLEIRGDIFQTALRENPLHAAALPAVARPEGIGMRQDDPAACPGRQSGMVRYLLRSGASALLPAADAAAQWEFLAAVEVDGGPAQAGHGSGNGNRHGGLHGRIRLAAPLRRAQVETLFTAHIRTEEQCSVREDGTLQARRQEKLDALILRDTPLPRPQGPAAAKAFCDFLRRRGPEGLALLPWTDELCSLRARTALLRSLDGATEKAAAGTEVASVWPDLSDARLLDALELWLAPYLEDCSNLRSLSADRLTAALHTLMPAQLRRLLAQQAPTHWTTPAGQARPVIYGEEGGPRLEAKLQEFFGCEDGPRIADNRLPLTLHLLSPAGRPLQVTRDLAGFWRGAYAAVRAEMRGRYPRHPWPEDPSTAQATGLTTKKFLQGRTHEPQKKS